MDISQNQGNFCNNQNQNNELALQIKSNRIEKRSSPQRSQNYLKETLIQRCENANPSVFKKYPHIYHNIMEIINQFFNEGRINAQNIDFLQQKVQKEINFQLNKLRTSSRIGLLENIFYNNSSVQQNRVNNTNSNSPLNRNQNQLQQEMIKQGNLNINNMNNKKNRLKKITNVNSRTDFYNNEQQQSNNDQYNQNRSQNLKQQFLGIESLTANNTPQNHQAINFNNIYGSTQQQQQNNKFGKAARSSSYMGDTAKKNILLEQILQRNKDSIGEYSNREKFDDQVRKNQRLKKVLHSQEAEIEGRNSSTIQQNHIQYIPRYSSIQRGESSQKVSQNVNKFYNESTQKNFKNKLNSLSQDKPNCLGCIAQSNLFNQTIGQFEGDISKYKINGNKSKLLNKSINLSDERDIDDDYKKELKKLAEIESEYEKQRSKNIYQKERNVYDTIKRSWDKQLEDKKSEFEKEKLLDKEYKMNIESLVEQEIHSNQLKKIEKIKQAIDDKQLILKQIKQKKDKKERQRSIEIQEDLKQLAQNENSFQNEKEQQRIVELNKIQQQNQMISTHIQMSKQLRENQEKMNRLDELKRIKDKIAQQHAIDSRKDQEYINRISRISKCLS